MRSLLPVTALFLSFLTGACAQPQLPAEWRKARNAQDRATLERLANDARANADRHANDPRALYQAALADSLRAEVLAEQKDKRGSGDAAEAGIKSAERAVALGPNNAEFHRLLGALCAQTIPSNILFAMRYGHCALDEVNRALQLDAHSADAWLSRGVGNLYLPPSFGGGPDQALKDIEKSLQFDTRNADAWLWQGIVLRKLNRNGDARRAFEKSLALDPSRAWARQQLEKTPEK
jgi:tetratricopeptide (TPR) repeat protein